MTDSDPGSSGGGDLAALPTELASQSLSRTTVLLPADAAVQAIALLTARGRRVEVWEGWVRLRDGGRTRSLAHGGSFALPRDASRAAEVASAGIRRAQEVWQRNPEYDGATLFIGLTFTAA